VGLARRGKLEGLGILVCSTGLPCVYPQFTETSISASIVTAMRPTRTEQSGIPVHAHLDAVLTTYGGRFAPSRGRNPNKGRCTQLNGCFMPSAIAIIHAPREIPA